MSSSLPRSRTDRYSPKPVNPPGTVVTAGWSWIKAQLPPDVANALQHLAETTGESQRSIVRRAVIGYLQTTGFPHLTHVPTTHTSRKGVNT
jgi:hypothetical protein